MYADIHTDSNSALASAAKPFCLYTLYIQPCRLHAPPWTDQLVQTCAKVPLQNFRYLLLKRYDEEDFDILALDFNEM